MQFIVFSVDSQIFAIELPRVERISLSVALIPLPYAAKNICGAVNVHGEVIPVVNLRNCLGITPREMELTDQFVICLLGNLKIALWVDNVFAVADYEQRDILPSERGLVGSHILGIIKDEDKSILICDWEKLLQLDPVRN